jgi:hypothetical protein
MNETELAIPSGCEADRLISTLEPDVRVRSGAAHSDGRAATSPFVSVLQRVFSFPVMLGTALTGAAFYTGLAFFVDPDLWWHLRVGEKILATHQVPTSDPYSFTVSGAPWMAYEWLGETFFAAVARLGGIPALDLLLIALSSAIVIGLYIFATLRTGNSKAAFIATAILFPIANGSFTLRPQMLGYLFLIFTLIALEAARRKVFWPLWLLPPLFLLWVNTHGSFIVGLGVIFVYWLCGLKRFRLGGIQGEAWLRTERLRLELVFLFCLAVLPLTPYGTRLAVYPFDMVFSQPINVSSIAEWQPMPFNLPGGKIFLGLLLAFLLTQIALPFLWRLEEVVLYVGGTVLAALHVRFVLLFVPFFVPILAAIFARWVPGYQRAKDKYILNALLMTAAAVGFVHYFPSRDKLNARVEERFPVQAVEYIRQHSVPEPMLNTYGFGGYLVWAGQKVFIDGRGDLYERGGVLSDYMHISRLKPGTLAVLQSYRLRSCLLERDEPLATLLSTVPGWKRVYADKLSALFIREESSGL